MNKRMKTEVNENLKKQLIDLWISEPQLTDDDDVTLTWCLGQQVPALVHFLHSLDFCSAVTKVMHTHTHTHTHTH